MVEAHITSVEVRELLIAKLRSDKVASPVEILRIVQKYGDSVERAIECATKAAPYWHPKLEAIEVKSEVEHKYVVHAPDQMISVQEWAIKTGAAFLESDHKSTDIKAKHQPAKPSLYDYEDTDQPLEPTKDKALKIQPAEKPLPAPTIKLTKSRLN
jgi:hypothetical protein